jgi:hypothetical protein
MPTTVTSTIGTATRDYSTIAAWEDATDVNIVTADELHVGECYNDAEFAEAVTIAGATTDATRYRHLTVAAGESFADHADKLTNALKYDQTKGVGISSSTFGAQVVYLQENYARVSRVQIEAISTADRGVRMDNTNNLASGVLVDGTYRQQGFYLSSTTAKCVNCLAIVRNTAGAVTGFHFQYFNVSTWGTFNCTAVRPSDLTGTVGGGFRHSNSGRAAVAKNCAAFGFVGGNEGFSNAAWASSDYNATDSATATGGGNDLVELTYANQFENVEDSTSDFRVKSGSDLDGAGVTDSSNTNDLDIVEQTREANPTIGAWEFIAGSGSGITVTPDKADLTLTGNAPTVSATANHRVTPSVGALAITGFAPTITVASQSITATPGKADLTLTANAPTVAVTQHQSVAPGKADLAITGFAPSVLVGIVTQPGAGALAITGHAPTVAVTANHLVNPGTAAIEVTGFAPTVSGGEAPVVDVQTRGVSGRKYRVIWEEDEILEEIQEEEKAVAKEKKKLKILIKQAKKLPKTGILYRQAEARIERFEQKIDDRLAKIAELLSIINEGINAIADDDEEVLLLS